MTGVQTCALPILKQQIYAVFLSGKIPPNNNFAYVFHATWAAGSTVTNGYVRLSYRGFNGSAPQLYLSVIDPSNGNYLIGDPNSNDPTGVPTLPGTFNFPVILSPLEPTVNLGGHYWC